MGRRELCSTGVGNLIPLGAIFRIGSGVFTRPPVILESQPAFATLTDVAKTKAKAPVIKAVLPMIVSSYARMPAELAICTNQIALHWLLFKKASSLFGRDEKKQKSLDCGVSRENRLCDAAQTFTLAVNTIPKLNCSCTTRCETPPSCLLGLSQTRPFKKTSNCMSHVAATLTPITAERPSRESSACGKNWSTLLQAAREGDDDALGKICDAYQDYLLLVASSDLAVGLRPKFGASDIVQETMLEACRDFNAFHGTTEQEFRVWLRRLVTHNMVDSTRKFRSTLRRDMAREVSVEQTPNAITLAGNDKTASSLIRRRETDEELLRAIARLPESRRAVVELRHREGLSYAEIAVRMNLSEAAARKLWSRTIQALRAELNPRHDEPAQRRIPR